MNENKIEDFKETFRKPLSWVENDDLPISRKIPLLLTFYTVVTSGKEMFEKEANSDIVKPSYLNEEDKIFPITIDITKVEGFEGSYVYHNDKRLDCVYLTMSDMISRNILINHNDFKVLYEYYSKTKILSAEKELIRIKDEYNKESEKSEN